MHSLATDPPTHTLTHSLARSLANNVDTRHQPLRRGGHRGRRPWLANHLRISTFEFTCSRLLENATGLRYPSHRGGLAPGGDGGSDAYVMS